MNEAPVQYASPEDDDDFPTVMMEAYLYFLESSQNPPPPRRPVRQTGHQWVIDTLQSERQCRHMYCMEPECFIGLHRRIKNSYGLKEGRKMSSIAGLALLLWCLAGPNSNCMAENRFCVAAGTVSKWFRYMLKKVYNLAVDIIKPVDANFQSIHPVLQQRHVKPWFDQCVGAIDGTHIEIAMDPGTHIPFISRHMYPTMNFLAVVDFDCRFIFASGHSGSMHDAMALRETLADYPHHFPMPPNGKYYLVDSAYANTPHFLAPYRDHRYHMQNYHSGPGPSCMQELFNFRHSQLRSVVERAFGMLKNKFRMLRSIPNFSLRNQYRIVIACMALHNFILETSNVNVSMHISNGGYQLIDDELINFQYNQIFEDNDDMGQYRDLIAAGMRMEYQG